MSETEINKGTLVPVNIYEFCERFGFKYENEEEMRDLLIDEGAAVKIDGKWYRVEWEIRSGEIYDGFALFERRANGDIRFHTMHYNGGGHWSEVLQNEMKRLSPK